MKNDLNRVPAKANKQKRINMKRRTAQETAATKSYTTLGYDAMEKASKVLDAAAFRVWIYLMKNKPDYKGWELSSGDAKKNWGIPEKQFQNAIKELIEKGFLNYVEDKDYPNTWEFCEFAADPSSKTDEGSSNKIDPSSKMDEGGSSKMDEGGSSKMDEGIIQNGRTNNITYNITNSISQTNITQGSLEGKGEQKGEERKQEEEEREAEIPKGKKTRNPGYISIGSSLYQHYETDDEGVWCWNDEDKEKQWKLIKPNLGQQ